MSLVCCACFFILNYKEMKMLTDMNNSVMHSTYEWKERMRNALPAPASAWSPQLLPMLLQMRVQMQSEDHPHHLIAVEE